MAKSASITVSNVATSTRQKPLVSINGDTYDHAELSAALQTARDILPSDTWSRTVSAAEEVTPAPAAPTSADASNAAANLKTPQ